MTRLPRPFRFVMLVLLVAGCAPTSPRPVGPGVNLSGYSPAFKEGFAAGCRSAKGNHSRDDARFKSDTEYKLGWDDGYSICGKK